MDEGVFTNLKDQAVGLDNFRASVAERLGCDPTSNPAVVRAAIDEALSETVQADEGTATIDTTGLAGLRADAERHRTARERTLVEAAIRDGRLRSFEREPWVAMLQDTPAAAAVLAGLPKGRVPVDGPRGYTGDLGAVGEGGLSDDLDRLFGNERR
ncbi:hypothetical protein E0H75_14260 [Kribbella capetownensis]|uniref:Uncharacterized protein n=1 Tax=Kribbella capetownensis TaxID=1572659 RepID=A0A4R0JWY3_9ACTN|nr:hypothetical protein [Kribbella capetownensis]TCC51280.1 hypothetical protein E0H75_14260 [Kribbella capetownensis]